MRRAISRSKLVGSKVLSDIDLNPSYFQTVTPEEFLEIYATRSSEIHSVSVIPATPGKPGFGNILVRWKTPIYIHHPLPDQKHE